MADPGAVPHTARPRGPYRKTDARRREILDAAFEVFSAAGYRAGSLKDIGARIGIDPSTILHHFGSKDALLLAVLDDKQTRDSHGAPDIEAWDPRELPEGLIALAELNDRVPGLISLYAVLSTESTTVDHPGAAYFRERTERTRRDFARGFQRMADAGLLAPGVDASYAATSTFALWDGIQIHWLITPDAVNVADTLRRHLRLITTVEI